MVNNAGIGVAATAPKTAQEDWEHVMRINLTGTFLGMKYAIPQIRNSGRGSVINVSSIAALVGIKDRAAYSAAKGGILALRDRPKRGTSNAPRVDLAGIQRAKGTEKSPLGDS